MLKFHRLYICLFFFIFCTACGTRSIEDFRAEGESLSRALTQELNQINTREELIAANPRLTQLFNELVNTIISAHEYRVKYPNELLQISFEGHNSNNQLRGELNRIYQIEGAREVIEKCQEEALNKLDVYERRLSK